MRIGRLHQMFLLTVSLMAFLTINSSIMALPLHQEHTCFSPQGCPEPINPEPDEYYAIQCDASMLYIWRDVPNRQIVTLIGIAQVATMSDGGSFVATGNVTVTRSGDTITLSGSNGNHAPQFGTKSFSIDQCSAFAAVLPVELISPTATLTDEQMACGTLSSEAERVACSQRLDCEDPVWSDLHPEICDVEEDFSSCDSPAYFFSDLRKCLKQSALNWIGVLLAEAFYLWYRCVFGQWPVAALVLLPSIRWLRRRKRR